MAKEKLPHNIEAEQAFLGSILHLGSLPADVEIRPTWFYRHAHALIWETMQRLAGNGDRIDLVTVVEALKAVDKLEETQGASYVSALVDQTPSPTEDGLRAYAGIIREKHVRRAAIRTARRLLEQAAEEETPIDQALTRAHIAIEEARKESPGGIGRFFFGKKFKPKLLADEIIAENRFVTVGDLGIYRYSEEEGYWKRIHESHIEQIAVMKLQNEAQRAWATDAVYQVKKRAALPPDKQMNMYAGKFMCVKNGMLDLDTKELLPQDPKYLSTYQVQANADPSADCPRFKQFCREALENERKIMVLQEWTGYCLTNDVSHEKAAFLVGRPQGGKSRYVRVLEHLVGHDARSNVTLRDLEDQFHRVTLFGKLINTSTETEFSKAFLSDYFQAIVSGDSIQAAYKTKDVFSFQPFCKLTFSMNHLPRPRDYTGAFFRRLLIIRFTRQFVGEDQDKGLLGKLLAEIDGILNWALVGLDRLREQGGFTYCEEMEYEMQEYRSDSVPVLSFAEERCVLQENGGKPIDSGKQELFADYKLFCDERNFRAVGYNHFFRQIYDLFPQVDAKRPRTKGKRERRIAGIALKSSVGKDV